MFFDLLKLFLSKKLTIQTDPSVDVSVCNSNIRYVEIERLCAISQSSHIEWQPDEILMPNMQNQIPRTNLICLQMFLSIGNLSKMASFILSHSVSNLGVIVFGDDPALGFSSGPKIMAKFWSPSSTVIDSMIIIIL